MAGCPCKGAGSPAELPDSLGPRAMGRVLSKRSAATSHVSATPQPWGGAPAVSHVPTLRVREENRPGPSRTKPPQVNTLVKGISPRCH